MRKEKALNKAHKLADKVLKGIVTESYLFTFCYENNIFASEIWNDDDTEIIGFAIEDDIYYYSETEI